MSRLVGLGSLATEIRKAKAALPTDRKLGLGPRGNRSSCCRKRNKDDPDDQCQDKLSNGSLDNIGYKQVSCSSCLNIKVYACTRSAS